MPGEPTLAPLPDRPRAAAIEEPAGPVRTAARWLGVGALVVMAGLFAFASAPMEMLLVIAGVFVGLVAVWRRYLSG